MFLIRAKVCSLPLIKVICLKKTGKNILNRCAIFSVSFVIFPFFDFQPKRDRDVLKFFLESKNSIKHWDQNSQLQSSINFLSVLSLSIIFLRIVEKAFAFIMEHKWELFLRALSFFQTRHKALQPVIVAI